MTSNESTAGTQANFSAVDVEAGNSHPIPGPRRRIRSDHPMPPTNGGAVPDPGQDSAATRKNIVTNTTAGSARTGRGRSPPPGKKSTPCGLIEVGAAPSAPSSAPICFLPFLPTTSGRLSGTSAAGVETTRTHAGTGWRCVIFHENAYRVWHSSYRDEDVAPRNRHHSRPSRWHNDNALTCTKSLFVDSCSRKRIAQRGCRNQKKKRNDSSDSTLTAQTGRRRSCKPSRTTSRLKGSSPSSFRQDSGAMLCPSASVRSRQTTTTIASSFPAHLAELDEKTLGFNKWARHPEHAAGVYTALRAAYKRADEAEARPQILEGEKRRPLEGAHVHEVEARPGRRRRRRDGASVLAWVIFGLIYLLSVSVLVYSHFLLGRWLWSCCFGRDREELRALLLADSSTSAADHIRKRPEKEGQTVRPASTRSTGSVFFIGAMAQETEQVDEVVENLHHISEIEGGHVDPPQTEEPADGEQDLAALDDAILNPEDARHYPGAQNPSAEAEQEQNTNMYEQPGQEHLHPLDRLIPRFHGSDIEDQQAIAGDGGKNRKRGECDVPVEIFLDYSSPPRTPGKCSVRFIGSEELASVGETPGFDFYFTDSLHKVPYLGRRDNWFFLERFKQEYWPLEELVSTDMDGLMRNKTKMISMLAPASARTDPDSLSYQFRMLLQQAQRIFPNDVFYDDKTDATYKESMDPYMKGPDDRFCMILDDELPKVSMAYLRALRHHCVPVFNGFSDFGGMFYDAVMPFEDLLNLPAFLENLNDLDHQIGALWSYQRTLQDMLYYRYRVGFEATLKQYACTICRMHKIRKETRRDAPLVFVGVYSALKNVQKRNVLRRTWLRVITKFGLRYKFFLNADNAVVRAENDQHDDMIFLGVSEGYRLNSRKGLLFHNWIAAHSNALYLLKIDDDIYFRPAPFLEQLRFKSPFMYIWGYFDYISPVPREPADHFFNPTEIYPYDMFPPYPRGVVRIVSMDVIRRFAELDKEGKLRTIFGDDPNMGVHMRHIVFDPDEPMSLNLDDIDSYKVFAMNPECKILNNTEPEIDYENPGNTKKVKQWSPMTNRSWVFHHVNHEQIECMWNTDVATGYYDETHLFPKKLIREGFPNLCPCIHDYDSWRSRREELEAWEEDRRLNPPLLVEADDDENAKDPEERAHPMG